MTSSTPANQMDLIALRMKKVPPAALSKPIVTPSPQNTAGPTLGLGFSGISTSGGRNRHMTQKSFRL